MEGTCDLADRDTKTEEIVVINKIARTPPKNNQHRSRTSRSDKSVSNRSRSNSVFSSQSRSDSVSSQKSDSAPRSNSTSSKKRKTDSPVADTSKQDRSNVSKNTKFDCHGCSKPLLKNDSSIECECCQQWYHNECQNLTEEAITAFKILGDQATYFCLNCKAGAKVLFKGMQVLQARMDQVDNEMSSIKTKVDNVKTSQTTQANKLKTLETVHSTLRRDLDNAQNDVKSLQLEQKTHAEDNIKLQTLQQANSVTITNMATRLNTIEEDIISRIDTIID